MGAARARRRAQADAGQFPSVCPMSHVPFVYFHIIHLIRSHRFCFLFVCFFVPRLAYVNFWVAMLRLQDHKPILLAERQRIEKTKGGFVKNGRVNGIIEVWILLYELCYL